MKPIKQSDFPYRNIISKKNIVKINNIKPHKKYNKYRKPHGLWYGFRHYWGENLLLKMYFMDIDYNIKKPNKIYKVKSLYKLTLKKNSLTDINNPNKNKILSLKTKKDMIKFTKKYKKNQKILWYNVMNDYGGIEIPRYHKKLHEYNLGGPLFSDDSKKKNIFDEIREWYDGWDVPSGTIWNSNVPHIIVKII
tara:strand:+ start:9 stop:587 length:579 start_codon:yes stop_codon:yes gene_type:complete